MAKNEYVEPTVLASLAELTDVGDATKVDYSEDAWSYGAPPPWDYYKLKLFLDKDGIRFGYEDTKNSKGLYITFKLIGKIVDVGDYEGVPVYFSVNTRIFRGKNISTMAGLISKMLADTSKLPNPITPKQLAELLEKCLKQEPVVTAEVDWKGSFSVPDPKDSSKVIWHNTHKSWKDFPNDPENVGEKLYEVSVDIPKQLGGGVADVRAMTQINRFYGKKEEKPKIDRKAEWEKKAKGGGSGGSTPSLQSKVATAVVPDLVLGDTPTATTVSGPVLHRAAEVAPVNDDDMALVLE